MPSSFADRLWWSRHKAGLGATKLARQVGCAQSLISSLERTNAEKSKLNNAFAKALHVDPTWLAHGVDDRAPAGFDEVYARRGRESMGKDVPSVGTVRLPEAPRWNDVEPLASPTGADAMMKGLVNQFMDFARLAGQERTLKLLETLKHLAMVLDAEDAGREQQVGHPN